ncbi:anhydro-N-acetylmuramic acid kinase [Atopostipes suicloacalis DSM 15692]|uniref:Anhydro-N-acetylmuramic acid kinase n=1 Tax=Atopostipes suicloacalis DSM 15692 TaxID=1121025 RepID=A0A1M4X5E9_9LACT|nr:anhydro-N-acetylmuramic acid kinase AnmK [Atopostipes suicloacalis]SHE88671.1 anhydro-N-acetylmuramic acid kinase [Atopostipes suicloacalis DSM 15692]
MTYAIGIMSGTSLDGVDAALVNITGVNEETEVELIAFETLEIPEKIDQQIRESFSIESSNSALISSLNVKLGELFADAAIKVSKAAKINLKDVDFIASHGQTIYHIPEETEKYSSSTLQIGEAAVIAEKTGCTVVSNFRPRDMTVGGQGAPIVPYSEYILYRHHERTRLLQNIGGIGNVTVIPPNASLNDLVAFDTGPGNMIINELSQHFYNEPYDKNGEHAKQGQVNEKVLEDWMNHPFILREPPKTTGREEFGLQFVQEYLNKYKLPAEDWLATATMFTARSIAKSVDKYTTEKTDLIIGGGGSYNPTLVQMIKEVLPEISVIRQEDLGLSSDAKEAVAMVILGNQTLHRQPSNVPSATGASKPVILGSVTFGEQN